MLHQLILETHNKHASLFLATIFSYWLLKQAWLGDFWESSEHLAGNKWESSHRMRTYSLWLEMHAHAQSYITLVTSPFQFPFLLLSMVQTMDVLKQRLNEDNVTYEEKVFATSESIAGLRTSPFVS